MGGDSSVTHAQQSFCSELGKSSHSNRAGTTDNADRPRSGEPLVWSLLISVRTELLLLSSPGSRLKNALSIVKFWKFVFKIRKCFLRKKKKNREKFYFLSHSVWECLTPISSCWFWSLKFFAKFKGVGRGSVWKEELLDSKRIHHTSSWKFQDGGGQDMVNI